MIRIASPAVVILGTLALGGCVVAPPTGPSAMALPGTGKSFDVFQQDDMACRQFATAQTGGASPAEAANQSAVGSAAVGTVLGAAAGAALGAAAGNPAVGAAAGAGAGLLTGSAAGAGAGAASGAALQQRYDAGYFQCMYAKGHQVPAAQPAAAYPGYAPYPYAAPYPAYAYPYPYAYPSVGIGFGFGFGGHHRHW